RASSSSAVSRSASRSRCGGTSLLAIATSSRRHGATGATAPTASATSPHPSSASRLPSHPGSARARAEPPRGWSVRAGRVELPWPEGHEDLNLARLPVAPRSRRAGSLRLRSAPALGRVVRQVVPVLALLLALTASP